MRSHERLRDLMRFEQQILSLVLRRLIGKFPQVAFSAVEVA
jgi:hypothetical protein